MVSHRTTILIVSLFSAACLRLDADTCNKGKSGLPAVQIHVKPDALALLERSGLTQPAIERAVSNGLSEGHIGCIRDNAITYAREIEDRVSVSITEDPENAFKPVVIDASVINGAAVSNPIVRWRERKSVGEDRKEVLGGIASVMKDLASAYGSPEYRKGRREE